MPRMGIGSEDGRLRTVDLSFPSRTWECAYLRSCASRTCRPALRAMIEAVQLPRHVRSQVQLGNELFPHPSHPRNPRLRIAFPKSVSTRSRVFSKNSPHGLLIAARSTLMQAGPAARVEGATICKLWRDPKPEDPRNEKTAIHNRHRTCLHFVVTQG